MVRLLTFVFLALSLPTIASADCTFYRDSDGDNYGVSSNTQTSGCGNPPTGYVYSSGDCNDTNASIHPWATDTCGDGVDQDCNGTTDDGTGILTYYRDADGDAYGTSGDQKWQCAVPSGYVKVSGDCNDGNAAVKPGATETCNNVDDDCDSQTDEGLPTTTYYRDQDVDGYGTPSTTQTKCSQPSGYVTNNTDCNDSASSVHPTATETCNSVDDDCDNLVDENVKTTYYADSDGDTYGNPSVSTQACSAPSNYVTNSSDCDDTRATSKPGGTEVCNGYDDDCDSSIDENVKTTYYRDVDGDTYGTTSPTTQACSAPAGYSANNTDCNDAVNTTHPNATETCNSVDDDCDTQVDEGVTSTFYRDQDGDNYGSNTDTSQRCSAGGGYVAASGDCDDTLNTRHPSATELCNGLDDDCDAQVDEGLQANTYYTDADADGYGTNSGATTACAAPPGKAGNNTDCNDAAASIHPTAPEVCNTLDDNCNGTADEGVTGTFYRDADSDGYGDAAVSTSTCAAQGGYVSNSTDCDDTLATRNPGNAETCDGVDNDCDTVVDDGVLNMYYRDLDSDGHGATVAASACTAPGGYVVASDDCDDTRNTVYPGATETCNLRDDDCDSQTDEGVTAFLYTDGDGDTYGDPATGADQCAASGRVADNSDCDDLAASRHPGATEVCDGVDQDCDGVSDDGLVFVTYYRDQDGDGYGVDALTVSACAVPSGYVATGGDCNDSSTALHPNATEVCNDVDDDCDTLVDDGFVQQSWHPDADGDGFGNPSSATLSCLQPSGTVLDATDCNDGSSQIRPGATEVCDGVDQDCDGTIDEGVKITFYADGDSDGYGSASTVTNTCSAPTGFVSDSTDCDDSKGFVHPGAVEVCDGVDDDCDGLVDESVKSPFYADVDGDGYGNAANGTLACTAPAGYVADATDCDDVLAGVFPGAIEVCNGADDDCNTLIDDNPSDPSTWYADADGDGQGAVATALIACDPPSGYVADARDCDDTRATTFDGAPEQCSNNLDDDCDGIIDSDAVSGTLWYLDADADGYGVATTTQTACSQPVGYALGTGDCDDTASTVHPGAPETCNSTDDDCDLAIDEEPTGAPIWYMDADQDGFGNPVATAAACVVPSGYVANAADCDDGDDTVLDGDDWWYDTDNDGFADETSTPVRACNAPIGTTDATGDCDDTTDAVFPGAPELCDGVDTDCDGVLDNDAVDAIAFYYDRDNDGYGDAASTVYACSRPGGTARQSGDCDDRAASVRPNAPEQCNGVDDDCDSVIDDAVVYVDWYPDFDGDGYGDAQSAPTNDCIAPAGAIDNGEDCDDGADGVNPSALEQCNGFDDDCDGYVDVDAYDSSLFYLDLDGDGFGDDATMVFVCDPPQDSVQTGGDCDDSDADSHPGAPEQCGDNADNDCNGIVDTDAVVSTWYLDADGDLHGVPGDTQESCSRPDGYAAVDDDCDDTDPDVHPGQADDPSDGVDSDCDGTSELVDVDGDGYEDEAAGGDDCDDSDPLVNPGATELEGDGIDQDCDGSDGFWDGDDRPWTPGGDDTGVTPPTVSGCACDGGGSGPLGLAIPLVALLIARRRRG
jgi:hypothetical protein